MTLMILETIKVFLNWLLPNYFKKENPAPPRPAAQEPPPESPLDILIGIYTPPPTQHIEDRNAKPVPIHSLSTNCLRPIALKRQSPPLSIAIPSMLFEPRDHFKLSKQTNFSRVEQRLPAI